MLGPTEGEGTAALRGLRDRDGLVPGGCVT